MNNNIIRLQIIKSKIDDGLTHEEVESFSNNQYGADITAQLKPEIEEYFEQKEIYREKNKRYWMLICNPMQWGDEAGEYIVNELLKNLHIKTEDDYEWWKINKQSNMHKKMKIGEKGIIKVSEDTRNDDLRTSKDGKIVDKLDSGIYGIFEVVECYDNKCIDESEYYVSIRMIENYFNDGINISKSKSNELIGETIYNSQSSRELNKVLFNKVLSYIDGIRK
ncbi:hypothetical protein [Poseidonibacter sp.]|uniref:hypothetical protein n=1 Tax=Poseidonibacter sp. TaxID=2321188 RepID=UPI003C749AA5